MEEIGYVNELLVNFELLFSCFNGRFWALAEKVVHVKR